MKNLLVPEITRMDPKDERVRTYKTRKIDLEDRTGVG